jgi:hypothetical protein
MPYILCLKRKGGKYPVLSEERGAEFYLLEPGYAFGNPGGRLKVVRKNPVYGIGMDTGGVMEPSEINNDTLREMPE